jgi:hypothetical protein
MAMKTVIGVVGLLAAALGGLWLLQGLGLVHVRPILCFADCATIQGRSTTWAVIGALTLVAGAFAMRHAWRRR